MPEKKVAWFGKTKSAERELGKKNRREGRKSMGKLCKGGIGC